MELTFRLCLKFDQPLRALDTAIGIVALHLALYALVGVGFMIEYHIYCRRVEVFITLVASIVPIVNGCFHIAKNVFNDRTYMLIQGIETVRDTSSA